MGRMVDPPPILSALIPHSKHGYGSTIFGSISGRWRVGPYVPKWRKLGPMKRFQLVGGKRTAISARSGEIAAVLTRGFSRWLIALPARATTQVRSPKWENRRLTNA